MKKVLLGLCLLGAVYTAEARRIVNNCQTSIRFFGIVTVWTGSIDVYDFDANGQEVLISSSPCGKNNGSWDWFWE
jgi:hypothetical protein